MTVPAGGVSPTAPDEREALRKAVSDAVYGDERVTLGTERLVENLWAAGFRRSREATTEPQPITDADVEVAARAIFAEEQCDRRQKATPESLAENWSNRLNERDQGEYRDIARAALEAVEASRSPKPTPEGGE